MGIKKIHKIGKVYTRIIMNNISILIFIGLLSVIFGEHGWFPNEDIYAISQLVYKILLPALISYEGGRSQGNFAGGVAGVLAVSGVLTFYPDMGIIMGMFLGPTAGWLWKHEEKRLTEKVNNSLQMLVKNLCIAVTGAVLSLVGLYIVCPVLSVLVGGIYAGADYLVERGMLAVLSILIEPSKVFFLNNIVNHGILVPFGVGAAQETGNSVLFLLETNPGPGFGLLAALCYLKKEQRNEFLPALFAEGVGGIHEVYFPYVLSDMWLMLPLILGGMAGNFCFGLMNAGVQGVVSPGSVITILLMAGKENMFLVLTGICVSALISFGGTILILKKRQKQHTKSIQPEIKKGEAEKEMTKRIERIVFVCDGGLGSSVMGAALFRRTLAQNGITDIQVDACAADMLPESVDMFVCQEDFYHTLPTVLDKKRGCTVKNLVSVEAYGDLVELIQKRNG